MDWGPFIIYSINFIAYSLPWSSRSHTTTDFARPCICIFFFFHIFSLIDTKKACPPILLMTLFPTFLSIYHLCFFIPHILTLTKHIVIWKPRLTFSHIHDALLVPVYLSIYTTYVVRIDPKGLNRYQINMKVQPRMNHKEGSTFPATLATPSILQRLPPTQMHYQQRNDHLYLYQRQQCHTCTTFQQYQSQWFIVDKNETKWKD